MRAKTVTAPPITCRIGVKMPDEEMPQVIPRSPHGGRQRVGVEKTDAVHPVEADKAEVSTVKSST